MKAPRPATPARRRKEGFTLLEMMVAALLLGMLVSMLTMIFTSSASAWRIGEAGAWGLRNARRDLAAWQRAATDALPRLKGKSGGNLGYISAVWVDGNTLKTSDGTQAKRGFSNKPPAGIGSEGASASQPGVTSGLTVNLESSKGARNYIVGAGSAGPDGEWDTDDDIVSWPEER